MDLVKPDFGLIFWMTVTFLIVFFIMKKFAWGPILKMIQEREESIEGALAAAEKAKEEMEKLQSSNEKLLAEARMEKDKMLKEAREIREKMISDAKDAAQKESQRILTEARNSIQNEKVAAINELKNQVALMSIEIAEKVVKKELSSNESQKVLVNTLINDIKLN
ncbi:MAG: F0F1 ATP synthase subunit B [Bacteroidia bacterium]|nr:F0F1 ATP synthase subunit B [Bacteroidia bacterium]MCZ2249349.1 F0F1 ATP synthase subunit B [Bacteroidia bacterium]